MPPLAPDSLTRPLPPTELRRAWQRALPRFDEHAAVLEVVGGRLRDRLEVLAETPARILDLGCRTGYQSRALVERYPEASITGADPAPGPPPSLPRAFPRWLRRRPAMPAQVACDPHALPFASASFDLVVSNLLLPFCRDLPRVFAEVARVLDRGGVLFFTTAGPDTLIEYRRAWAAVDGHPHVFGLVDMHDIGDAMVAAGFASPVLDRDDVTVDYPSLEALERELRGVGAVNLAAGRRAGLTSPMVRKLLDHADEGANPTRRWPVTLELVQGHAFKGEPRQARAPDGAAMVPLESLRQSVRRPTKD